MQWSDEDWIGEWKNSPYGSLQEVVRGNRETRLMKINESSVIVTSRKLAAIVYVMRSMAGTIQSGYDDRKAPREYAGSWITIAWRNY